MTKEHDEESKEICLAQYQSKPVQFLTRRRNFVIPCMSPFFI